MPRDDERLTLDGEDDVQGVDAAVVKELSKQIRWSAMALGKIEGFFEQIVKNSESSEKRMTQAAGALREEIRAELDEVKETLDEVTNRLARVESTVREMKITEDGLITECTRKWAECQMPTAPVVTEETPAVATVTTKLPSTWYGALIQGIFKQPIYFAIAGLIFAIVVLALMMSDDLRSWLAQLFG